MNAKKFSDAMSELDNKYIDEALNYKKKVKKPIWIKWGAMVASLLLVFTMSVPALAAADLDQLIIYSTRYLRQLPKS